MAFGTATIADVAKDPGGNAIPFAVVFSYPRNAFANSGTNAAAHSAIANAAGVFTLSGLEETDSAGNSCPDTFLTDLVAGVSVYGSLHYGSHHVTVMDPGSGEHVFDVDCVVPSATTSSQPAGVTIPPAKLSDLAALPMG